MTNKQKIIIAIVAVPVCLIMFLVWIFIVEPNPTSESEKIIRDYFGEYLDKDPNSLTDDDFAQIPEFRYANGELSDIKLLEKFTNL